MKFQKVLTEEELGNKEFGFSEDNLKVATVVSIHNSLINDILDYSDKAGD